VRRRIAFVLVTLTLGTVLAGESDEISWIRVDGAPGWRATIPRELHQDGVVASPVLAPTWFAKFPNATIPLAPQGTFDLASARGKVVLIDYWASWCGPCLKELPHLQQLHLTRGGAGFVAVAVNADEDAATASESAKRLGLTMIIGVNDPEVYRTLAVRTLPTLVILDKQGRLRARWDGYRNGLENEIAAKVDKLLADDPTGTTHEVAAALSGQGRLAALWSRDLAGAADGVVGLPPGIEGGRRVVASGGGELVSFDAAGEVVARVRPGSTAGRLIDFGAAADGTREVVGFHPGATSVGVIALRSGAERTIAVPAPVLDVAASGEPSGDGRRLAIATLRGAATAAANDQRAALIEGAGGVRSLAAIPGHGVVGLQESGTIGALDGSTPAWPKPAVGAERLLAAREDGAVAGPRTVVASVSGRFLPEGGRQLAVATYAGHLTVLDESSGRILFDAAWADVHDLAAVDLDGDGHDELLVASARSVTALGAARH
jgi:thiol-disulfide isomerase/thioredoxin